MGAGLRGVPHRSALLHCAPAREPSFRSRHLASYIERIPCPQLLPSRAPGGFMRRAVGQVSACVTLLTALATAPVRGQEDAGLSPKRRATSRPRSIPWRLSPSEPTLCPGCGSGTAPSCWPTARGPPRTPTGDPVGPAPGQPAQLSPGARARGRDDAAAGRSRVRPGSGTRRGGHRPSPIRCTTVSARCGRPAPAAGSWTCAGTAAETCGPCWPGSALCSATP